MYRALIIGMKGRGVHLARTVQEHDEFELAGLADIDAEVLAERSDEFDVPEAGRHSDYREALGSGLYDVAIVVTPNHTHYAISKDVINAGVHCLVEKPFTEKYHHAEELVELAAEKNIVLEVAQNYRFLGICRFVSDFVREKKLGELGGIEGSFCRSRPPRYDHERVMEFPMLFLHAVHHMDWLLDLLPSDVKTVIGKHRHVPWSKWDNPSICHIILECEDGVLVSYRGSYESQGHATTSIGSWRFEFEKGDLMIDGDQAVWQVTNNDPNKEQLYKAGDEKDKTGTKALLDTFHHAIVNGTEPPTSGRNNLKTLKLMFEIFGKPAE